MRPRISVYVAMSLDGFIAGPDGQLDWLEGAAAAGEDYGFEDYLRGVDAVAMGRRTWDVIAGIDDLPYGDRPLYVFTHRPAPGRAGVTFWQRDPAAAVADWVERGHRAVYVDGGTLVSAFLAEGSSTTSPSPWCRPCSARVRRCSMTVRAPRPCHWTACSTGQAGWSSSGTTGADPRPRNRRWGASSDWAAAGPGPRVGSHPRGN